MPLRLDGTDAFQAQFHARWNHLRNPHVRALAWLIGAPDLLDPHAPRWEGKIASLGACAAEEAAGWLAELDAAPGELHAHLNLQPFTRLGRYAESLMTFYLRHLGILQAHGVQVRASCNETIGEFDFLLLRDGALIHWEFATKLYLLESSGCGMQADYFVGPNLADTLGTKMRKIFDRQLNLSSHPAAQALLPQPVILAQALVKGWLFYHDADPMAAASIGVDENHCCGFWKSMKEFETSGGRYAILPRLSWLAPAKMNEEETLGGDLLMQKLHRHFAEDRVPLLIACLEEQGGAWLEARRGFIVPDDWSTRAGQRVSGDVAQA